MIGVATVIGTRPEAIKLAPVVHEFRRRPHAFEQIVVATGQHREMLDQTLEVFDIEPDLDLDLMEADQSLAGLAARTLIALEDAICYLRPDVVLIQGDTTTAFAGALAAFYSGVLVGHVEAGLRSFDRANPYPEEINRRLAGCVANMHFAPTERARANLLREGTPADSVYVTGNTVVDALAMIPVRDSFDSHELGAIDFESTRLLLVTAHRRESHGDQLRGMCRALRAIVENFDDVAIVYPVHLSPRVRSIVNAELTGVGRIHIVEPVSYRDLLSLMSRCYAVLTDSGGIQEEAPSFRKPVLILRERTERPEVVDAGAAKIVGTDPEWIVAETALLLRDDRLYRAMSAVENPFGDGRAADRIVSILEREIDPGRSAETARRASSISRVGSQDLWLGSRARS